MQKTDDREIVVLSLGGSLIAPSGIDYDYMKRLRKVILKHIESMRFIIVTGGGKPAREYIDSASRITAISSEEKDWLGIYATRMNALLVKTIFKDKAHEKIITDPTRNINFDQDILVSSGFHPGNTTDYVAVLLAKKFNVKTIVNLTNIDYVYDKDPKKYKSAKPVKDLNWNEFFEIMGKKFSPGMNSPFDPVAAKEAQENGLKVLIANGHKIANLDKLLYGEIFKGTIIQ